MLLIHSTWVITTYQERAKAQNATLEKPEKEIWFGTEGRKHATNKQEYSSNICVCSQLLKTSATNENILKPEKQLESKYDF